MTLEEAERQVPPTMAMLEQVRGRRGDELLYAGSQLDGTFPGQPALPSDRARANGTSRGFAQARRRDYAVGRTQRGEEWRVMVVMFIETEHFDRAREILR